jgi:predicted metal-dependent enzyme (double-stranded beta helix superfamily)
MSVQDYGLSGREELIHMLDEAVRQPTTEAKTSAIEVGLSRLIAAHAIDLPEDTQIAGTNSYARRLLYKSPSLGYAVVAMAWGPDQGTPLHDHAGTWCVEGVWKGELEVTQFDLVEQDDALYRFDPQLSITAHPGSSGSLIPPFEYHTIKNRLSDDTSITIHVYGRDLTVCSIFEPQADSWFTRSSRKLTYDN